MSYNEFSLTKEKEKKSKLEVRYLTLAIVILKKRRIQNWVLLSKSLIASTNMVQIS